MIRSIAFGLAILPSLAAQSGEAAEPRTTPEATGYERTSTTADVREFLDALSKRPAAGRIRTEVCGKSKEGRDLLLVTVANPIPAAGADLAGDRRLRVLVNGNIHGGEVEGKEAVQQLLREFAEGDHGELLDDAIYLFVPIYNADGNDAIDRKNRVSQNGPVGGVGQRPNAQDLDLNRDFIKAESPECEAMLTLFRRHDPHLFVDLHTTNGSHHGYDLTWAPSLSTNVATAIDGFARGTLLPEIQRNTQDLHSVSTFPYGILRGRTTKRWITYDHRPRFGTNYYGLRNRFSILSEAYSYATFETRIRATHGFTLEILRSAHRHRLHIRRACRNADRAMLDPLRPAWFGFDTTIAPGQEAELLLGTVQRTEVEGIGTRLARTDERTPVQALISDRFYSRQNSRFPEAWWITKPSPRILGLLQRHGVRFERIDQPRSVAVSKFEIDKVVVGRRVYQGHRETRVDGAWRDAEAAPMPAGAIRIPARQALARVAAQLLEPQSEDSATTWNGFDPLVEGATHPVLRERKP